MSRYEESAKANRLFCHRGLGRKHPALSPSKYISAASGCGDMGGDHYAAMELLNNLYVAVHKKPRDIEVVGRARSNKSPARAAREFRCQLRVIKIPRLRFSRRGTGAVAFKQGWVCASTTEYERKPSGVQPTEGRQP